MTAQTTLDTTARGYLRRVRRLLEGTDLEAASSLLESITEEFEGVDDVAVRSRIEQIGSPEYVTADLRAEVANRPHDAGWYTWLTAFLVTFGGFPPAPRMDRRRRTPLELQDLAEATPHHRYRYLACRDARRCRKSRVMGFERTRRHRDLRADSERGGHCDDRPRERAAHRCCRVGHRRRAQPPARRAAVRPAPRRRHLADRRRATDQAGASLA